MWSSGKDSMALLHLVRSMGYAWPVILYRNPLFPQKYDFADRIISEWNLRVYDYPPLAMGLQHKNGQVEVVALYGISSTAHLRLPTNMVPIEGASDWVCGVHALNRPTGRMQFPWDVLVIGHKSCDTDITEGRVPLHTSLHHNLNAPDLAFPLRDWSHEDVWEYIERHQIPVQETRYERTAEGWRERDEKTFNPDCTPICIRCVDRRVHGQVECPLLNRPIDNVGQEFPYLPDHGLTYFGEPTSTQEVSCQPS